MPRFFVPDGAVAGGRAAIAGADAAHLARSLRARPGEEVVVVDRAGVEHGVRLDLVGPERCAGEVVWSRPSTAEPRLAITVLQAIPQQGMEDAVEAMVQAGVRAVVPMVTARTVVRLEPGRAARRVERWRLVAREAASLAGRGRIPHVGEVVTLSDALAAPSRGRRLLAAATGATVALAGVTVDPSLPVAVAVGPEGGFDDAELALLRAAQAEEVHLGPRVLRARLAGAVATVLLLAAAADLTRPTRHEDEM